MSNCEESLRQGLICRKLMNFKKLGLRQFHRNSQMILRNRKENAMRSKFTESSNHLSPIQWVFSCLAYTVERERKYTGTFFHYSSDLE